MSRLNGTLEFSLACNKRVEELSLGEFVTAPVCMRDNLRTVDVTGLDDSGTLTPIPPSEPSTNSCMSREVVTISDASVPYLKICSLHVAEKTTLPPSVPSSVNQAQPDSQQSQIHRLHLHCTLTDQKVYCPSF